MRRGHPCSPNRVLRASVSAIGTSLAFKAFNMETQSRDNNSSRNMEQTNNSEQREGKVARAIETQTAKIPSDWFLWSALGSIGISLGFAVSGKKGVANFIGQWAPTFLLLGLYNKVVKVAGHDKLDSNPSY